MAVRSNTVRAQSHRKLGTLIEQGTTLILQRWCERAIAEHPKAKRLHHEALRNDLPQLLKTLSQSLAASKPVNGHCATAGQHGKQRWEVGWSLGEVVQDYQILRLVLVDYLQEGLNRALRASEMMAIGLVLDEAIAGSVEAHTQENEARFRASDEALRKQADQLQDLNRRKDEFLAVLGHELRNPLAPLRNALQVLKLRSEPEMVAWSREIIERQVVQLTQLVDDLLNASRISQGKLVLDRSVHDLAALVREVLEDRLVGISEAGLKLKLEISDEPVWVDGDPLRLRQVVWNLLQNAVKFSEPGEQIVVRVQPDRQREQAVLAIRDHGMGIEPELLPRLFDAFAQGRHALEAGRTGLGLGLALVRGFVALHNGAVEVSSDGPGSGSEFIVRLPLAPPPAQNTPAHADT